MKCSQLISSACDVNNIFNVYGMVLCNMSGSQSQASSSAFVNVIMEPTSTIESRSSAQLRSADGTSCVLSWCAWINVHVVLPQTQNYADDCQWGLQFNAIHNQHHHILMFMMMIVAVELAAVGNTIQIGSSLHADPDSHAYLLQWHRHHHHRRKCHHHYLEALNLEG